jgi:hypothetical protein
MNDWKNNGWLITILFFVGCSTFQSQTTTHTGKNEVPTQAEKQLSPELRGKIATEAQKAIPAEFSLEKNSIYGKREGTLRGVRYVYEGDLMGEIYHGQGKLTYANGLSYQGGFKDGQYEGKGLLIYPNGDRYEGEFHQGKRHGQGILITADGKRQVGQFIDDDWIVK